MKYVITVDDVYVVFESLSGKVFALKGASIKIAEKDKICITGPSGSGKTTFLNLIYGEVKPFSGEIHVLGRDLSKISEKELIGLRSNIGYATQEGLFIEHLTIMENMRLKFTSRSSSNDVDDRLVSEARELGIDKILNRFPNEISVGEKKRAEIMLALFDEPSIMLIDEPTAMLDSENVYRVLEYIKKKAVNSTLIITTHDPRIHNLCEKVYELVDGRLNPR